MVVAVIAPAVDAAVVTAAFVNAKVLASTSFRRLSYPQ